MKNLSKILVSFGIVGALAQVGAAVCTPGVACNNPASAGTGSWVASASQMKAINAGANGNPDGSRFYVAASTTNQGATLAKGSLSTVGDGSEVLGNFQTSSGGSVVGLVVTNLLGNRAYTIYVE